MQLSNLSGPLIVLLLAGTVLTATIFIIFAKRQITRFTLRTRHTPHVPLGNNANKQVKREIERRIDAVEKLYHEPALLPDEKPEAGAKLPPYYYRMRAVDDIKVLEKEIPLTRGSQPLRSFLINYLGSSQKLVHQFCDCYEHARFDPAEYGDEEYQKFHHLLLKVIEASKITRNTAKISPNRNRTPVKKSKMQPLLDPSRLKVVPQMLAPETRNSQLNLSIGLQQQQLQDENEILSISTNMHDVPKIEML